MTRPRLSLASQILALHLVVVLVALGVGGAVTLFTVRQELDDYHGRRSLGIAQSVAVMPAVRGAFDDADPSRTLQPIAESVRRRTGAAFVVVADRHQVRLAHPDRWKIGRRLSTDASGVLAGHPFVGVQTGSLGRSVRAKVPVRGPRGGIVGVVSVGFMERRVTAELWHNLPLFAGFLALAALAGVAGSLLVARRVKRQTFGLEPAEIGRLVEQREAMLRGIREGVVVVDLEGRVGLVNDEAHRLLDLPADCVGRPVPALDLPPRILDVLTGQASDRDEVVLRRGRLLAMNWMPVLVRDERVGAIVTLRDRTELDSLTRELRGARHTSDALRAKAHEFANQMHTVAGLIELREYDEALHYISETAEAGHRVSGRVADAVGEPTLAALLIAKSAEAAERGVQMRLAPETALAAGTCDAGDLVTIVGNLVDNALDAVGTDGGWVDVTVRGDERGVLVKVRDSGPGIEPGLVQEVFEHGFTTKVARTGGVRGLGLALTRQACVRRGGWVDATNDSGACFTAWLPLPDAQGSRRDDDPSVGPPAPDPEPDRTGVVL
jgi:two-component system, CitB family, sensor kinase